MSAKIIDFPNPAAPDAEEVRSLLAKLRRLGANIESSDPCVGAMRVWHESHRRGMREPNTRTVIDELRREREAEEWLPCDVIDFPEELREEPLRTLQALWHYETGRAAYLRAWREGTEQPLPATRRASNAYGDCHRKPGKRQAAQMLEDIEAARAYSEGWHDTPRDDVLNAFIQVRQMGGRPLSRGLELIGRAVRSRKTGNRRCLSMRRLDGPGAA